MKALDIQKHIGKVTALDLVNGQTIVTRVEKVEQGYVKCRRFLVFTVGVNPTKPSELQIGNLPYGAPLFEMEDTVEIDLNHIVMAFTPNPQMDQVYTKVTSGIIPVSSGLIVP